MSRQAQRHRTPPMNNSHALCRCLPKPDKPPFHVLPHARIPSTTTPQRSHRHIPNPAHTDVNLDGRLLASIRSACRMAQVPSPQTGPTQNHHQPRSRSQIQMSTHHPSMQHLPHGPFRPCISPSPQNSHIDPGRFDAPPDLLARPSGRSAVKIIPKPKLFFSSCSSTCLPPDPSSPRPNPHRAQAWAVVQAY